MKINKEILVMGLLVAMLLVSSVQAFQLLGIKSDLAEEGISSLGSGSSSGKAASSSPIDIQADIPDQVGGCF